MDDLISSMEKAKTWSPGHEEEENLSRQKVLSSWVKDCMIWAVNDGDVDAKYLRVLEGDEIRHTRWKEELRRNTFVKYREYLSLKWMVGIWS